jgi:pantothenate synthetase
MSSRNALLTPEHRAAAPDIYRALQLGRELAPKFGREHYRKLAPESGREFAPEQDAERSGSEKPGKMSRQEFETLVRKEIERSGLLKLIYFDFMGSQACVAVQAGGVRLIDNLNYGLTAEGGQHPERAL